jgi:hypothetical protein
MTDRNPPVPPVMCIECYRLVPLSQADIVAMGYLCATCSRLARTPATEGGRPLLHAQPSMVLECPRTWGSLAQTTDPNVRHCGSCGHLVHRADSDVELREHARLGHCVTVKLPNASPYGVANNKTGMVTYDTRPHGADTAWLVVLNGPLQNAVIALVGESVTIGSGPADIAIDNADLGLAPQHVRFVREDDVVRFYDLTQPEVQPHEVHDGDIIAFGNARAMFKTVRYMDSLPDATQRRRADGGVS